MVKIVATQFLQCIPADMTQEHVSITPTLIDILDEHNLRLVDIADIWDTIISHLITIRNELDNTVNAKNNEKLVELV